MFFDGLVRTRNIPFVTLTRALAAFTLFTLWSVSPWTHREILTYFRQDSAVRRFASSLLILVTLPALIAISEGQIQNAEARAKPIPSSNPTWPPPGYDGREGVYAKLPSRKELIGDATAKASLRRQIALCKEEKLACASVKVAAERGCAWWEVNSAVRRLDPNTEKKVKIGSLVTYARGTEPREFSTIMLISKESADVSVSIGSIKVICHPSSDARPKLGNIYNPIAIEGS